MKLMVISNPTCFKGEDKLINQLFDHGLEIFHMRKPQTEKVDYSRLLGKIAVQYRSRIALHDHHDLAVEFGINRLHYTENARKILPKEWSRKKNAGQITSTSIHSVEDLSSVQEFNYVFLSPVFDSYSKAGYQAIAPEHLNFRQQKLTVQHPTELEIIALGGIGIQTIGRVKSLGFNGAAMLGWIWNNPLMSVSNFKQIRCWINENM